MKRWLPDAIFTAGLLGLAALVGWQQHLLNRSWSREEEMATLANRLDVRSYRWESIAKDWELAANLYKQSAETFRQAAYFCVTPTAGDAPKFEVPK